MSVYPVPSTPPRKAKSDKFYTQTSSSALPTSTPGAASAVLMAHFLPMPWALGVLHYHQIEHNVWPDLRTLSYQKAPPEPRHCR